VTRTQRTSNAPQRRSHSIALTFSPGTYFLCGSGNDCHLRCKSSTFNRMRNLLLHIRRLAGSRTSPPRGQCDSRVAPLALLLYPPDQDDQPLPKISSFLRSTRRCVALAQGARQHGTKVRKHYHLDSRVFASFPRTAIPSRLATALSSGQLVYSFMRQWVNMESVARCPQPACLLSPGSYAICAAHEEFAEL
jgi:hypothetical protein